jgi:hypothetical protein
LLALDLAVITVVVGLLGLGAGYVLDKRKKRKERDPREKGKRNAARMDAEDLRCSICLKTINPDVDIYTQGSWWHKDCYRDVIE